jgi:ABC-type multidrug transport system fused ATPase/permease subunit
MLRAYWDLLARYLRAQVGAVAVLAALVVGNVGLQLFSPQVLRYFVDTATTGGALQTLTVAAGVYFAAALAQQLVSIGVAYAGETVAWRATNALRADLTLHCLRLDPQFHQEHPPGELIERIDGDVNALANFFSQFLLLLVANALFLVGMLVLIAREQWAIGLVLTAFTLAMFALMARVQARIVPYIRTVNQAVAELLGFLEERLAGIEDLQSRGAVAYVLRLYHAQEVQLLNASVRDNLTRFGPAPAGRPMRPRASGSVRVLRACIKCSAAPARPEGLLPMSRRLPAAHPASSTTSRAVGEGPTAERSDAAALCPTPSGPPGAFDWPEALR